VFTVVVINDSCMHPLLLIALAIDVLNRLRNPWKCSFDRKTNELYCADVGQEATEEVNLVSYSL
jgi:hypothetical protein